MFTVYGWDKKTDDRVILHSNDWRPGAINWAKGYTKQGDTGGWDMIIVVETYQVDIDWDGNSVTEERVIWSCWSEPMRWSDNAHEEF